MAGRGKLASGTEGVRPFYIENGASTRLTGAASFTMTSDASPVGCPVAGRIDEGPIGQALQERGTKLQVEWSDFEFAFRFKTLNVQFDCFREGRLGSKRNFQLLFGNGAVANSQLAEHRN